MKRSKKKSVSTAVSYTHLALKSKTVNMAVSCVSGVGLGFVGVGIPDIPIFTASIFKSIYETALSLSLIHI